MKMKGRKATVFWVNLIALLGLYVLTLQTAPEILNSLGSLIIIMIVGNGATFIGGQVADEWQRSKYYRSELEGR